MLPVHLSPFPQGSLAFPSVFLRAWISSSGFVLSAGGEVPEVNKPPLLQWRLCTVCMELNASFQEMYSFLFFLTLAFM